MFIQRSFSPLSWLVMIALMAGLVGPAWSPVQAQGSCGDAPPPRLVIGGQARVSYTDGQPLNVRGAAGLTGAIIAQLPEGTPFTVLDGPVCADNINWWQIQAGNTTAWVAEGIGDTYFVEPVGAAGPESGGAFATWDWDAFVGETSTWNQAPTPMMIAPPPVYAGDLPPLPVDLSNVMFLEDGGLNADQLALLAQNGFVVVPAGFEQFHQAYAEDEVWWIVPPDYDWEADPANQTSVGHAYFVTTDAMLHALHYIFDNLLTDLERDELWAIMVLQVVQPSLEQAQRQAQQLAGTPLAQPARNAALYLAVGLELLSPGSMASIVTPDLAAEAQSIVAMALAGEGQVELPFLQGYVEDFSQYRPRGHYEGDPLLESYFRGMMWLSRITFLADDPAATQTALLLLRALQDAPGAYDSWRAVHDTLSFLIGPIDDLGPTEYGPLADSIYGSGFALESLADANLLTAFRAGVTELPGPRVNGLIVPDDTQADELATQTRGFRFLGQRFTFDAYVMQQLMYPYVGTRENPRLLPLGLDVASAVGSETAYALAAEAGATDFLNYDMQTAALRGELGALTDEQWLENVYGGWLWALEPLWKREAAPYPPLMQTEAWLRRDLHTGLASWTELKHDTVLYAKQPTGFGGGGMPLTSYGYVEPNPLVFARIAIVAAVTYRGFEERGMVKQLEWGAPGQGLQTTLAELRSLAFNSARFAEMARKELAGEPLTEDDYWSIVGFGTYLNILLRTLYQGEGDPDPVALVTDVANNPSIQAVLQEAVGGVDYIYVVVPTPDGRMQLVRGGAFSYYEWVGNINQRMTDSEWRALVESGELPPRPDWVSAFISG